jgi:large subunit ribosomal protein L23
MKLGRKKKEAGAQTQARGFHYDVIVSPIITEKSTRVSEQNKVMFNVRLDANKTDIKSAVEALFNVKVKSVNTLIRLGKEKRFRDTMGKLTDTKKAIITLAEGQSINLEGGVK